jgi:FkbM family methyltransferase
VIHEPDETTKGKSVSVRLQTLPFVPSDNRKRPLPPNGHLSQFILGQFPEGYRGYAIDVGASDGISINTTYVLEIAHLWTVLSVEANPEFAQFLKSSRAFVEMCACSDHQGTATFHANQENLEALSSLAPTDRADLIRDNAANNKWQEFEVRVETVDSLMQKWQFPQLDALCIDTEGTELDVLKGCSLERWRPKVIVTECWDRVGPIDLYLEARNYKKTARNAMNDVWILR